MPVHKTYLYLLSTFTYFYDIFDVGKEKISMNDFLLLLIIFVYHLNFYEYILLLTKRKIKMFLL